MSLLRKIFFKEPGKKFPEGLLGDILNALGASGDFKSAVHSVLYLLKEAFDCDAVGLRLEEREDYPYFSQVGFTEDFLLKENSLLERNVKGDICRNEDGSVCLQCTCGLVLSGKTPKDNPLFTPGGSCWTNNSFPLLDIPDEEDPRTNPRNECIHSNYASVALIPVKVGSEIRGLLQLNGYKRNRFSLEIVERLEKLGLIIGHSLMRIQAEQNIREKEQELRIFKRATDYANYGVGFADLDGTLLYVNEYFAHIHGYEPGEVTGKHFSVFHTEEQMEEYKSKHHNFFGEKFIRPFGSLHVHRDGYEFPMLMSGVVIEGEKDGNKTLAVCAIDLTEYKKQQEQLRCVDKLASLGQLAAGIAHNFNNQLTGVIGYANILNSVIDDPKLKFVPNSTDNNPRRFFTNVIVPYFFRSDDSVWALSGDDVDEAFDLLLEGQHCHPQCLQGTSVCLPGSSLRLSGVTRSFSEMDPPIVVAVRVYYRVKWWWIFCNKLYDGLVSEEMYRENSC